VILATATGSFDVIDKTMPMIVIVPKDSPLSRLTMRQLDGIFGEQRDGGYEGQYWRRDRARDRRETSGPGANLASREHGRTSRSPCTVTTSCATTSPSILPRACSMEATSGRQACTSSRSA